ncbi:MAG: FAD:protein FMN transferase [Hyphomonadaceae bacterium JAD_PAG50586_4]|nr:MAG: FAD:protein FMN transferase [Hyphomonadaceae bacterium JAD_PAG50586_4]
MRKFCRQSDGAFDPTLGALVDLWGLGARAVDQVIALVTLARLPACLVEIGGELRGYGVKPDSQPWWVELEQPPRAYTPRTLVALFDLAIATSGDDRRHAVVDGHKISHTISTLTGRPVNKRVASVGPVHKSCMQADAYASAITALGVEPLASRT